MSSVAFAQSGFKGTVLDAETREPMPFTNVTLLEVADSSLVRGVTTNTSGDFVLEAEPGAYLMRVSFVGYREFYTEVEAEEGKRVNLKNLMVVPDAEMLAEFEVQAMKSTFRSDIDKRVFNVENSIAAEGGTAIDVLETLPSIQVDEEGGVRMRGSGQVLIYINGRPTNLDADDAESILSQFPANAIKEIELITNPSSKYDASGAGGIINIVLKKDERTGLNGSANISAGTRHKYNGGVSLNYGSGKTNYFANYNFRYEERFSNNETQRESFIPGSSRFLDQDYFTLRTTRGHVARMGMDHNFSDRSNLGIYAQANVRNGYRSRDYSQRLSNEIGALDSLINRNIYETNLQGNYEAGLNYTLELDTAGTKLTASASYAYDNRDRLEVFSQTVRFADDALGPDRFELQNFERPRTSQLIQAQADYEKPFANGTRLEAGVKSTIEFENRPQIFENFNFENDNFELVPRGTNEVDFDRTVHAAYGIFRGSFGNLGYQVGLRGEQTDERIYDTDSDQTVTKSYFDLFPSMYLSYELKEGHDLIVNYSRRINRPGMWALAPLVNLQDPLNQRIGNPNLNPEYTDSYEVGTAKSFKDYFVTATLFHRRTTDVLSRIFIDGGANTALMTWENINTELATGLEVINQVELGNWMDATLTGTLFYNQVQGGAENPDFDRSTMSWTLNLLTNMKIPNIATVQVLANYRGPMVRPQGIIRPLYGVNVGLRRDVLNGKGTISLNVTDVFNTRRFIVEVEEDGFQQTRIFDWETQIATIAFTYRFGGFKDRRPEDSRGGGGMDEDAM